MKILWLSNATLPSTAKALNLKASDGAGWIEGMLKELKNEDIELFICSTLYNIDKIIEAKDNNISYFIIPKKIADPSIYDKSIEVYFKNIIDKVRPDIIHIFGTEFPHTLALINSSPDENFIVSIQGLTSIYEKHYLSNLPLYIFKNEKFKRLIRKNTILMDQDKFKKRGKFEIEALKKVKNVIGRTTWDYACVNQINSDINYFFCNETLREEFYNHEWNINKCEKYSIFLSQGTYPIKGLHSVLEAMKEVLKHYPKAHIYVAGTSIINNIGGFKGKLKAGLPNYSEYLLDLITKFKLGKCITFLGNLNEKQMCEQYLKSNVFVLPSSIENSPNSLGEAMILGVPCIASCVGGVQDMLKDREEGFIYPFDEPYMLAHYICEVFKNDNLACKLSQNAKLHARITHNKEINKNQIIKIYKDILL